MQPSASRAAGGFVTEVLRLGAISSGGDAMKTWGSNGARDGGKGIAANEDGFEGSDDEGPSNRDFGSGSGGGGGSEELVRGDESDMGGVDGSFLALFFSTCAKLWYYGLGPVKAGMWAERQALEVRKRVIALLRLALFQLAPHFLPFFLSFLFSILNPIPHSQTHQRSIHTRSWVPVATDVFARTSPGPR